MRPGLERGYKKLGQKRRMQVAQDRAACRCALVAACLIVQITKSTKHRRNQDTDN